MSFVSIPEAIDEIRAGRMVVVVDDEDRENEGDLTIAAEKVTPEIINFMATYGRGLVCLAMTPERCDSLDLPLMSKDNTSKFGTAFCQTIDAAEGVTTGISAADRARTILVAVDATARPEDLARPGHVFPLRARGGGVLVRAGQTEASVDLARLAGLTPAGVICEIMNEDGSMARVPELLEFCRQHDMKMCSVADLIRYRLHHERIVQRIGEGCLKTAYGEFRTIAYSSRIDPEVHMAVVMGELSGRERVLVRMHSHCLYGDVFGSADCDCGRLVKESLRRIAEDGAGVMVYMHQTGPGLKIKWDGPGGVANLESHGREPAPLASAALKRDFQREIGVGAQILSDLGVRTIRLLTNHPRRIVALEGFGIQVVEQVPV